jgi:predicted AlkP superfamily phosphohydrolase/phosphomutase
MKKSISGINCRASAILIDAQCNNNGEEMKEEKKVLVIGLDGATFDLIEPWVAEGKLPNLGALMKQGSWGHLISTLQSNSAQAWSTFITGVNAGRHGIFDFIRLIPGSYKVQFTNASLRDSKSLWKTVSEHGWKAGIMNVPMTYPPEPVNGFLISGMDAPGVNSNFVYPPEILNELQSNLGGYILEAGVTGFIRRGRPDLALSKMYETIEIRLKAAEYLMKNKEWNLFMVVFTEPDRAQHFFWKYMNKVHPNYNDAEAEKYGQGILSIYKKLDEAIGKLLALVPEETTLFIMSDHGGGPSSNKTFYINKWLEAEGYLTFSSAGHVKDTLNKWKRNTLRKIDYYLSAKLPREVKENLVRLLPGLRNKVGSAILLDNINWQKTKVFSRESAPVISINLKGRDPEGIVDPQDYKQVQDEIIERLLSLRCPYSGEPIVSEVYRKEDIYSGPYIDLTPDLLIEWKDYKYIQRPSFLSKARGFIEVLEGKELELAERMSRPSGIHRPEGIVLCVGKGIRKGKRIQDAKLMDLHPTILYAMRLPISEEVEGKVIEELFEPDFLAKSPPYIKRSEKVAGDTSRKKAFTDEESDIIKERLSGLGYID